MNGPATPPGFNALEISFNLAADIIVFIGPDGVVLDMNPRFEGVTGRKVAEIIGTPFSKTGLLTEAAVTVIKRNLLAILDNRPAPAFEIELKTATRGFQPFEVRGTPIFDAGGKVIAIHAILRNIAKRKQYAQDLMELKEFLGSVIDACPDPIFVKDRFHRWVILNDAFCSLIGLPLAELIGKSDYDVFPKEEAQTSWKIDNEVFRSGKPNESIASFTDAKGKSALIRTRKAIFTNPTSGALFLFGIIRTAAAPDAANKTLARLGTALKRLVH